MLLTLYTYQLYFVNFQSWYINSLNKKTKNNDIKLETLYDFFKNSNNTEYDENGLPAADENIGDFNNEILDDKITQDKIMTCIKI